MTSRDLYWAQERTQHNRSYYPDRHRERCSVHVLDLRHPIQLSKKTNSNPVEVGCARDGC